jgi:hypothetical protein
MNNLDEIRRSVNQNIFFVDKKEFDSLKKITKTTKISDYEVDTPNGWVDIEALHETIPYQVYELKLENGYELKCADNHILINDDDCEIFVKDLLVGDFVKTDKGLSKVISVIDLGYDEIMYDLELSENSNRVYYTNGILSHNTFLAKKLAKEIFGSEDSLIRVDMSEYQEKHTISRLIGSPPGYVGHEEGGQLTEQVKNKPYSVILFDEVEKANKDVFSTLLQMLDDGHMTDGLGRKINFKNCLIIMTSNIGVRKTQEFGTGVGFKSSNNSDAVQEEYKRDVLKKELSKFFAPEFLNRIDDIVIFNSLKKEHIDQIVKLELDKLINRLKSMKYNIGYENSVIDLISKVGFDEQYGARPLKRAIQDKIEDLVSEKILMNEVLEEKRYLLVVKGEGDDQVIEIECGDVTEPKKRGRKKKED